MSKEQKKFDFTMSTPGHALSRENLTVLAIPKITLHVYGFAERCDSEKFGRDFWEVKAEVERVVVSCPPVLPLPDKGVTLYAVDVWPLLQAFGADDSVYDAAHNHIRDSDLFAKPTPTPVDI